MLRRHIPGQRWEKTQSTLSRLHGAERDDESTRKKKTKLKCGEYLSESFWLLLILRLFLVGEEFSDLQKRSSWTRRNRQTFISKIQTKKSDEISTLNLKNRHYKFGLCFFKASYSNLMF